LRPFVVQVMSLDRAMKGGSTMTTSITGRTELAHRTSDGVDIYLFWNEPANRVTVGVIDLRTDDGFEVEVDGRRALHAFNHPYAYAARRDAGSDSQETTINPGRSDHARTDR
jgi:hypothetical protein